MNKLLFFLLLIPTFGNSQEVKIALKVLQSLSSQAKIYRYHGSQTIPVDSSLQVEQGLYRFTIPAGYEQGLYRIAVGKNTAFNIVVANEPVIDIQTMVFAPEDSLKFINSAENTIYWKYQKMKRKTSQHAWLLRSLIDLYPDTSVFRQKLLGELYRIEIELYAFALKIINENPGLLASKFISLEQRPVSPPFIDSELVTEYLKKIWWSKVDLSDERIINTPEFPKYLWGYIEALYNDGIDKELQDDSFVAGIDYLMGMPMTTRVRSYLRAQLIEGFADSNYDLVVEQLYTKPYGELPALLSSKEYWKQRGEGPDLKIGQKAYDFSIKNKTGKPQKISKIKAKYKLLVFWSSWCPHCLETLPRLADVYSRYKSIDLEVIAINIDEDERHYNAYISKMNLNWINIHEPNTGSSKILHMYNVNETPKMFLLTEDLRIVSRPSTKRQLESKLRQLLR